MNCFYGNDVVVNYTDSSFLFLFAGKYSTLHFMLTFFWFCKETRELIVLPVILNFIYLFHVCTYFTVSLM
jgi:hypothetical protein